jgi:hypothetical protein
MTTLELWNAALGIVGHDRTVTSEDATVDASIEASRCRTFWPGARRSVLASRPWQWLVIEDTLSADGNGEDGVVYRFTKPDDMLRLIDARALDGTPLLAQVFGAYLISDAEELLIRYVADDTSVETWPALIADAVTYELAARIAIPMTGNFELSNGLRGLSASFIEQAADQYTDSPEGETRQERQEAQQGGSRR